MHRSRMLRWASLFVATLGLSSLPLLSHAQKLSPFTSSSQKGLRPTQTSLDKLPPLKLKVVVPAGSKIPPTLGKYLTKELNVLSLQTQQIQLKVVEGKPLKAILADPRVHVELERPKDVIRRVVVRPFNLDARISHNVPNLVSTFALENGKGVIAAVFDEGGIRDSHREFITEDKMSRVTLMTQKPLSEHSTHVAGTMGAKGVKIRALGMAPALSLRSFDWDNDLVDLETHGVKFQVSNHSYGPVSGWDLRGNTWIWWGDLALSKTEDAKFGKYNSDNSILDGILHKRPHLLTVVAAGNDRNDGPEAQPIVHLVLGIDPDTGSLAWMLSDDIRPRDGGDTGLDTIAGLGVSKNCLCVGAIHDVKPSPGNRRIEITEFSSFGPTDDGRIKPDVVANGFQLLSTSDLADDAYIDLSGTSMASPTAAGIACLLVEHFRKTLKREPVSAEIKAVMIHTATDAGVPGPDPIYGWGSIDAFRAGKVISSEVGQIIGIYKDNAVSKDKESKYTMTATGEPIRVTLVWIDPPGPPNDKGLNDPTPVLQNDLDLRLVAPNGKVFHPYRFDLANLWDAKKKQPKLARKDGPNRVDNVEVIDAESVAGDWKVEVKAHELKAGSPQSFALVVSGLKPKEK